MLASGSPRRRESARDSASRFEVRPRRGRRDAAAGRGAARLRGAPGARKKRGPPAGPESWCSPPTRRWCSTARSWASRRTATKRAPCSAGSPAAGTKCSPASPLDDPAAGRLARGVASSEVRMGALSEERIAWYVATGEPLDRAGAYAIQGLGAAAGRGGARQLLQRRRSALAAGGRPLPRARLRPAVVPGLSPRPSRASAGSAEGREALTLPYPSNFIGSPSSASAKLAMIWWPLKSSTRTSSASSRSAATLAKECA